MKERYSSNPFYHTKAWQLCRDEVMARDNYLCQHCLKRKIIKAADMVHHIKPLENFPDLALEKDNLISLCNTCHEKIHAKMKKRDTREEVCKRHARVIISKANKVLK